MNKPVIYIHGAFSTKQSFNWIVEKLPKHQIHFIEYDAKDSIKTVAKRVNELVNELGGADIVAHSLGGLVAILAALDNSKIGRVITISAPLGGSDVAGTLAWLSPHELYQSLNKMGPVIRKIHSSNISFPLCSIITTSGGSPMISGPNDGVVSVQSQKALAGTRQIEVDLNHFEVLMNDNVVSLIKEFLDVA